MWKIWPVFVWTVCTFSVRRVIFSMDPDVELMYVLSEEKRVSRNNLKVNLSADHNRKPLTASREALIQEIWSQ